MWCVGHITYKERGLVGIGFPFKISFNRQFCDCMPFLCHPASISLSACKGSTYNTCTDLVHSRVFSFVTACHFFVILQAFLCLLVKAAPIIRVQILFRVYSGLSCFNCLSVFVSCSGEWANVHVLLVHCGSVLESSAPQCCV